MRDGIVIWLDLWSGSKNTHNCNELIDYHAPLLGHKQISIQLQTRKIFWIFSCFIYRVFCFDRGVERIFAFLYIFLKTIRHHKNM